MDRPISIIVTLLIASVLFLTEGFAGIPSQNQVTERSALGEPGVTFPVIHGMQDFIPRDSILEKANTFRALGEWPSAKKAYETGLKGSLSPADKGAALFGYADTLYQMGQFQKSYLRYKDAAPLDSSYRYKDPTSLFQFGEAAYQSGNLSHAKTVFLDFYNIHPKHPLAPLALLRAHTLFMDGKQQETPAMLSAPPIPSPMDEALNALISRPVDSDAGELFNAGRILLSVTALKGCAQQVTSSDKTDGLFLKDESIPCSLPLAQQAFLPTPTLSDSHRQDIRVNALLLLERQAPSTTSQGVLIEAVEQLKKYKEIKSIVEIDAALLMHLPPFSPYRKRIQMELDDMVSHQMAKIEDPMTVITLYHTYAPAFTGKMMQQEPGFIIAMHHIKMGLLSPAVTLLRPIADNNKAHFSNEALYQLGQIALQLEEHEQAKQILEEYQRRLRRRGGARAASDLGDLYFREGNIDKAIQQYQQGLPGNVNHPDHDKIALKLAEAHRFRNDYDNEIKVYLKWIERNPEGSNLPYMKLADAYFQSGQYAEAVDSYQWILHNQKEEREVMEWAQLRLAMAYELLGMHDEGKRLFKSLLRTAQDPLIKKMAEENLVSSILGEPRNTIALPGSAFLPG